MADKKEAAKDKKEKKDKKPLPLLSIVTVVLVVVTLGISVFSLLTVKNVATTLDLMYRGVEVEEKEMGEVPLDEIEIIKFKDKFILSYPDPEDGSMYNIVVEVSFGVRNNDDYADEYAKIKAAFENKEDIVRDGMESKFKEKSYTDFGDNEKILALKEELKEYLNLRLGSTAVVDVYFNNMLSSHR